MLNLIRFNTGFCLLIILWGAFVRLSGSGAGCGDHWPMCNGVVVPQDPSFKTFVEYFHRLTSGIFGITVLWQMIKSLKGSKQLKISSGFVLFFTLAEALIGAVLVKKGLVVDNDSALRALVIGFHLVNTFFLLASLIFSHHFARHTISDDKNRDGPIMMGYLLVALFLIVGAFGAIAALGNTLFPSESLVEGVKADFIHHHFLIRLRIFHPLIAILTTIVAFYWSFKWREVFGPLKILHYFHWILISAVVFGFINWILMAPTWGALVHLLLADLLWIQFIALFCCLLFRPSAYKKRLNNAT